MAKVKTLIDSLPIYEKCDRMSKGSVWSFLRKSQIIQQEIAKMVSVEFDMFSSYSEYGFEYMETIYLFNPNVTYDMVRFWPERINYDDIFEERYGDIESKLGGRHGNFASFLQNFGTKFFTRASVANRTGVEQTIIQQVAKLDHEAASSLTAYTSSYKTRYSGYGRAGSITPSDDKGFLEQAALSFRNEKSRIPELSVSGILTPEAIEACEAFEKLYRGGAKTQVVIKQPAQQIVLNIPAKEWFVAQINGRAVTQSAVMEVIDEIVGELYKQAHQAIHAQYADSVAMALNDKPLANDLFSKLLKSLDLPVVNLSVTHKDVSAKVASALFQMLLARKVELESKLLGDNEEKRAAAAMLASSGVL